MPFGPPGIAGPDRPTQHRPRRRPTTLIPGLLCLLGAAVASLGADSPTNLPPVLTRAGQVLALTPEQAGRALPVHLDAVVVYADPDWGIWFLKDPTGGICLNRTQTEPTLKPGQRLELDGTAAMGAFAPIVTENELRITGRGELPGARVFSTEELVGGAQDSQWVEVEGVVRAAWVEGGHLQLKLRPAYELRAFVPGFYNQPAPSDLVDARVRLRGVWASEVNAQEQLAGYKMFIPSIEAIRRVTPPPAGPFDLPLQPAASTLRFRPGLDFGHRVRVSGTVTAQESPWVFYLQDESGGRRIHSRQALRLAPGEKVEAAGFPEIGDASPRLEESVIRRLGRGATVAPQSVDAASGLTDEWDSRLITLQGRLVEQRSRGSRGELLLEAGSTLFAAHLEHADAAADLQRFTLGSVLAVTGVGSLRSDEDNTPLSLRLILRSAEDVKVLVAGPWWNLPRALITFLLLTLILLVWRWYGMRSEGRVREQYRQLFEKANDLICKQTLDGGFVALNGAWVRLTGYPMPVLLQKGWSLLLAPEYREGYRKWLDAVGVGKAAPPHQVEVLAADGRRVWLELSGRRTGEDPPRIDSIARDITARKHTEAALREKDQLLRLVIDLVPHSIFAKDRYSRFLFANRAAARTVGKSPEEMVGLCDSDLRRGPGEVDSYMRDDREVIASGKPKFIAEERVTDADGQVRIHQTIKIPFPAPGTGEPAILGVATDITERRQAELALRKSEERFSAVFRTSPAAIAIVTWDSGVYQDVNPAFTELLGYTREEVLGRTAADFRIWERPEQRAGILATLESGGRVYDRECVYRTKAGELRWALVAADTIELDNRRCLIFINHDITGRKAAEMRQTELESMLRESQKLEAVGTLAGGIAHDFNNILGAILGRAELARMDLTLEHPAQESLDAIVKASGRARDLVRQILSFSRRDRQDRKWVDLRSVVREALALLRASLPTTIEITTDFPAQAPAVFADGTQVHQIILNLGANAGHAIGDHGGRIHVTQTDLTLEDGAPPVAALAPGRYVRLDFEDTGCGMDAATLGRIFEPFFTTKGPREGTGLGLSVVHGIMRSHEGAVTVQSQVGVGTTFHLYFPASDAPLPGEVKPTSELPLGRGERILVVDDEAPLVQVMVRVLEKLNYKTTGCESPAAAREAFAAAPESFALVLTDLTMPETTGLELAREFRQVRPTLPIILCSGYVGQASRASALEEGIAAFISKPVEAQALARAVRRLLDPVPPPV